MQISNMIYMTFENFYMLALNIKNFLYFKVIIFKLQAPWYLHFLCLFGVSIKKDKFCVLEEKYFNSSKYLFSDRYDGYETSPALSRYSTYSYTDYPLSRQLGFDKLEETSPTPLYRAAVSSSSYGRAELDPRLIATSVAPPARPQMRFDPFTGEPYKFDPFTGEPIEPDGVRSQSGSRYWYNRTANSLICIGGDCCLSLFNLRIRECRTDFIHEPGRLVLRVYFCWGLCVVT